MPENTWDTIEGLPDDFDFIIDDAYFGYRDEYQNGEVALLIWEGHSPDEDVDSIIWPCGSGWEVTNRGANVSHPKRNRFVKTSMVGRLIDRVVKELGVDMASRGDATEASVWKGLGFHMRREEMSFGPGILEDRGGKTTHLMPVEFLGEQGAKASKKAGTKTEAKGGGDDLVMKKLSVLAKKLDKDEWQQKAMDMKEVVDNDDLMAKVLDDSEEGLYEQLRAG
ncbi:MAG: hypothetical protein ACTSYX_09465 [Candidatus Thorarchaeota archaeon]